jgi:MinD superfamily P-loop ATPase
MVGAVASGKGGTGNTTVVGAFAALADADVDAPNLQLLLAPRPVEEQDYSGARPAHVDESTCTGCGRCEDVCECGSIAEFRVDRRRCEGCGTCAVVCPVEGDRHERPEHGKPLS